MITFRYPHSGMIKWGMRSEWHAHPGRDAVQRVLASTHIVLTAQSSRHRRYWLRLKWHLGHALGGGMR